jgi:hypothetical protein
MPLAKIRKKIANRLVEQRAHRRLSAELASFQSPAELAELDEMIARYPDDQTREVRAILDRQAASRQHAAGARRSW